MSNAVNDQKIQDFEILYNSLKDKILLEPGNVLLRRKLAYLALYLGFCQEAYSLSCSLDFYGSTKQQNSRQRTLELYLNLKEPSKNSSQVASGIFCKGNFMEHKESFDKSLGKKISNIWGWKNCSSMSFRASSLKSPRYIRNNIASCKFVPGVELDYGANDVLQGERVIGFWLYKGILSFGGVRFPVVFKFDEYPDNEHAIDIFVEESACKDLLGYFGETAICYFLHDGEKESSWLDVKIDLYDIFSRKPQQFEKDLSFYQAHEEWGLAGLRPTKLRLSEYKIDRWLDKSKDVLDIGCNIGCFGIEVAEKCNNYFGIDYNKEVIQVASKLASYKGVENCKFENIGFFDFIDKNNKKYDFVFSFAVHGWIGLPMKEYIEIVKSLLNPGGMVLIESHDLVSDSQRKDFAKSMNHMIDLGFVVVDKGDINDDGRRKRMFYTFILECLS